MNQVTTFEDIFPPLAQCLKGIFPKGTSTFSSVLI